jgi:hypothetical protein
MSQGRTMLYPFQTRFIKPLSRVLQLWPYLFIVVSVSGLTYIAMNAR